VLQVVTLRLPFMQPTATNPRNGDVRTLTSDQSANASAVTVDGAIVPYS
jgi:hypothetical protein